MENIVILASCEHHIIRWHGNLVQHPSNNTSIICMNISRSQGPGGRCVRCPCNQNENSCSLLPSTQVQCNCKPGYSGSMCQYTGIVQYLVGILCVWEIFFLVLAARFIRLHGKPYLVSNFKQLFLKI